MKTFMGMRAQKGETLKHTKSVLANEILGLEVEVLQKRSKQNTRS